MSDEILEHYGVKGMKWGVRRSRKELAARNKRAKAAENRRTLSDDKLYSGIERLKAERQLKQLTEEDLQPGRAAVKQVLADTGKKTAKLVLTGAVMYAGKAALDSKFRMNEKGEMLGIDKGAIAKYLFPNPHK